MPKKIKDLQKQSDAASTQAASDSTTQPQASKARPARHKSPATGKTPTRRKKSSTEAGEKAKAGLEPSLDEIRQRAYFISERRAQLSLPPDASADWLEARRQLFAEAGIAIS